MQRRLWCGTAALLAFAAVGCGTGDDGPGATAATGGAGGAGYPVEVTDCEGGKTTFTAAPEKIVTSNASSLELLLRLGVGDKVVGTGFPPAKGALPAELDAPAQRVKVLSDSVIPKEKLLGSGADLYIDTFASVNRGGHGMGDVPTEKEFEAVGIRHVYLKSTACAGSAKGPVTDLGKVTEDIRTLGAITGTSAKATALVDAMDRKVGAVRKAVGQTPEKDRPTYFLFDYDAGTKQPIAVCNRQIANAVISLAGARNVFADCDATFKPVGWEDVVAADPDWIQLAVRNRGSAAATEKAYDEARAWLRGNAATSGLKAVKEDRFLRIGSEVTTIAGVRNADTVHRIAATLYPGKVRADR
ncbi:MULTISPECIES: ABC transporter substrate-binding protein [Streptomyces]|uniref:ABC transporter substrate-binding protein n=2 Tax=Streptomyces TaxID=1883 RepID=A0A100Y7B0_9ACTN|nr:MULTISPECIES: ABC transporter substrate-binding protein [Streptomyces]KUH38989.1 ABC transporter substrate-binding protein [Streptomyces kanasensis]UUS31594.1 ABC transporter substrate-binding protein [Streptomyces changanensis]